MSVKRHLPATLALAAALALGTSACGTDDAPAPGAAPATTAPTTAPTVASSTVPGTSDATGGPSAAASATGSAAPEPSATSEEPVDGSGNEIDPVSGDPTVTDYAVRIGDAGDACQFIDGVVNCFFVAQSLDASCSGETPVARATFDGTAVAVECWGEGDAGLVPTLAPGEIVKDPDGAFLCEAVTGAAPGLRCSQTQTGRTAVLTGAQAALQS